MSDNNGTPILVFKAEIIDKNLDVVCPCNHIQTLSYLKDIITHKVMMLMTEAEIKKDFEKKKMKKIILPQTIFNKLRRR